MTVEEHAKQCRPVVDQKIENIETLLKQRMDSIESHIEEITRMVEKLTEREDDRYSRINAIKVEIAKMETRISQIETLERNNSPKNLLVTGTSILTFLSVLALVIQKLIGG